MIFEFDSLENFMRTNWGLVQHHKWSLTEIEEMIPWERDVNIALTIAYLAEEKERIKLERNTR